jgi:acyl-CoA synthetase (AMP-forming)/AMP-acid ligase II
MHWLATDDAGVDAADQWREPALNRETLAFLQYTSGSTAAPKGVMVSHGNLLSNERMVQQAFGHTEQSTFAGWLPLYHDMGLIGNVLQPLYIGAACILMAPMAFLQRPVRWLQAISRYRARTSGGPNFAYDLCVRKITDEQRAALDLSSWRVAFNGAEPVRASTLEQFTATFAPCGFRPETFYPCYGLAEATLFVSGGTPAALPIFQTVQGTALEHNQALTASADHEATRRLVGCGQTWQEQQIRIVDPETQTECPGGRVGEIWVSGPNVAQGYWQHADATERTFQARLAGTQDGPFLRTGDLGFMQDGELFVTGRLKDMIIISGRNHYPQDIEQTVEHSHPAIRLGCCAAFSIDVDGEERLVVAAEVDRHHRPPSRNASLETGNLPEGMAPADGESMVKAIRRAVVEQHDLRVHEVVLLKVGGVPKTSSGKIQRHACRNGLLAGSLDLWAGSGERRRRSEAASHAVPEATRISAIGTARP